MDRVIVVFILVLVLVGGVILLAIQLSDSETDRLQAQAAAVEAEGRARAMVIEAQGQARLDSAQAMIPILAVIVLGLFGFAGLVLIAVLGVVFVSYLVKLRDYRQPPPQHIYILPRGAYHPALPSPHEPQNLIIYEPEREQVRQ